MRMAVQPHGGHFWSTQGQVQRPMDVVSLRIDNAERMANQLNDVEISPTNYMTAFLRQRGWRLPPSAITIPNVIPEVETAAAEVSPLQSCAACLGQAGMQSIAYVTVAALPRLRNCSSIYELCCRPACCACKAAVPDWADLGCRTLHACCALSAPLSSFADSAVLLPAPYIHFLLYLQNMGKEKPVWRLAFFSRLEERKGIKLFVDAVTNLNTSGVQNFEVQYTCILGMAPAVQPVSCRVTDVHSSDTCAANAGLASCAKRIEACCAECLSWPAFCCSTITNICEQVFFVGSEAKIDMRPSSIWLKEHTAAWPWKTHLKACSCSCCKPQLA